MSISRQFLYLCNISRIRLGHGDTGVQVSLVCQGEGEMAAQSSVKFVLGSVGKSPGNSIAVDPYPWNPYRQGAPSSGPGRVME